MTQEKKSTFLVNSLHVEVIYMFQFRNAEIAHNQQSWSDGQSW